MSFTVEKLENSMAKITIEVSADKLEKAIQEAYTRSRGRINIPGFRKGKVPRQVIEKTYGTAVFYEDAANILIPEEYELMLSECEEEIVSEPDITVEQIEKGKEFVFIAEVALKPEIGLGNYKGIKVSKTDVSVTDKDIEEAIEKERESNAREISVTDRAVRDKDEVVLDFAGSVDGQLFDGGTAENYSLVIGSGTFIPGFEEQLIGAEIDKPLDVKVTFPEDYHSEGLKGKDAVFACTIREIKEKQLPELDDEFASEVSEFDTLDEYREDVKNKLENKKADEAKAKKEDEAIAKLIEDSDIELPKPMVDSAVKQRIRNFDRSLRMQGMNLSTYMQIANLTEEQLMEEYAPEVEKGLKTRLVLEGVAKAENMEASDEEYEEKVAEFARNSRLDVEDYKKYLDADAEKSIRQDILISKAADLIAELAVEE